jgi:hypothetical protein
MNQLDKHFQVDVGFYTTVMKENADEDNWFENKSNLISVKKTCGVNQLMIAIKRLFETFIRTMWIPSTQQRLTTRHQQLWNEFANLGTPCSCTDDFWKLERSPFIKVVSREVLTEEVKKQIWNKIGTMLSKTIERGPSQQPFIANGFAQSGFNQEGVTNNGLIRIERVQWRKESICSTAESRVKAFPLSQTVNSVVEPFIHRSLVRIPAGSQGVPPILDCIADSVMDEYKSICENVCQAIRNELQGNTNSTLKIAQYRKIINRVVDQLQEETTQQSSIVKNRVLEILAPKYKYSFATT